MSTAQHQARLAVRRIIHFRSMSIGQYSASGHGRKPMINFDIKSRSHGKGSLETRQRCSTLVRCLYHGTASTDTKPGLPHPMAPKNIDFNSFGKSKPAGSTQQAAASKQPSSSSQSQQSQQQQQKPPSSTKGLPPADFEEFYEMPKRYWTRPPLEEAEMEAIMVRLSRLHDVYCTCTDMVSFVRRVEELRTYRAEVREGRCA
jgi:hypothetical protein